MLSRQATFALMASAILAALPSIPGFAAQPESLPANFSKSPLRHAATGKHPHAERRELKMRKNIQSASAENPKRSHKARRRHKVMYNAFNDRLFGFNLARDGKAGIRSDDNRLGIGIHDRRIQTEAYRQDGQQSALSYPGYASLGSAAANPMSSLLSPPPTAPRKMNSNDNGIAFDYREKYPYTSFTQRELSASYIQKLDKSWKAQTYLSKGFSYSGSDWGGGLMLGYDY